METGEALTDRQYALLNIHTEWNARANMRASMDESPTAYAEITHTLFMILDDLRWASLPTAVTSQKDILSLCRAYLQKIETYANRLWMCCPDDDVRLHFAHQTQWLIGIIWSTAGRGIGKP